MPSEELRITNYELRMAAGDGSEPVAARNGSGVPWFAGGVDVDVLRNAASIVIEAGNEVIAAGNGLMAMAADLHATMPFNAGWARRAARRPAASWQ